MSNSTVPKTHRGLVSEELLNDFNKLVLLFWIQTVKKKKKRKHEKEFTAKIQALLPGG